MNSRILDWYSSALGESWFLALRGFLESPEMEHIRTFTLSRRQSGANVLPTADCMFKAFELTPYKDVRVVILSQDPYHTPGYPTGLAFSSGKESPLPPSLRNILNELESDISGGLDLDKYEKYNLESWAQQGVLLMNTALTVEEGKPGIHADVWRPFTEAVLTSLQDKTGVIYVLWGKYAQSYKKFIKSDFNYILEAPHPSPFSARTGFFGSKPFSKINSILKTLNNESIIWK